MEKVLKSLIGKEVQIYPGDSDSKFGIVTSVGPEGVLFKITKSNCNNYVVGKQHFISYSSRLSFSEI